MIPLGSHLIIDVLKKLDSKNDNTEYNKKYRRFVRYGIIYFESYRPFCFYKKKSCHLRKRSYYK